MFDAEQQAGLLIGLADGRERPSAHPARRGAPDARRERGLDARVKRAPTAGMLQVAEVDAPARKYEFSGHERVARMPPAHQHLR